MLVGAFTIAILDSWLQSWGGGYCPSVPPLATPMMGFPFPLGIPFPWSSLGYTVGCVCANRRRLTFGGVRRRRQHAADRKAELPLIAAGAGYSDMTLRTRRRLDGAMLDDTGDESDCTATTTGDLRFYYDCKRPLQCYQVGRATMCC